MTQVNLMAAAVCVSLLALTTFVGLPPCRAQVFLDIPVPHTTFVVFADRHLDDDQWTAFVAELHKSQEDSAKKIPTLAGDFEVLRGEDLELGLRVENGISVYLHGDCTLLPGPRHLVMGALGWVPLDHGRIEPFVHVECSRISEMLAPQALGMRRDRRNTVMAEAIARVVMHEWIHVATQNAAHGHSGVTKSQFQVSDLLAADEKLRPPQEIHHGRRHQSGM